MCTLSKTGKLSALPPSSEMTRNSVHLFQPVSPTALKERQMNIVSKKKSQQSVRAKEKSRRESRIKIKASAASKLHIAKELTCFSQIYRNTHIGESTNKTLLKI